MSTHFHGVSFNPASHGVRTFVADELPRELADPEVFSWIDLQGNDIGALNEVLRSMGIDLVLVSHFDAPEVLPRMVERADCLAFYLYEVEDPDRHLDTSHGLTEFRFHRMILVLGHDFVLTFHRKTLAAVEEVKATCADCFRLAGRTPGFIAFLFLQRCLYDYAHLNLANDNFLDALDDGLRHGHQAEMAEELSVAGQNILTLKKLVASLHIVLMRLATQRSRFISLEAVASFKEMLQSAQSVRAAVDSSRDLLGGALEAIPPHAAHRTREVARGLTVLSGVLLPLTLIAGIYGMNFEHMPETKWHLGYFGVLGLMALVVLALLYAFRRLGWIGRSKP